MRTTSSENKRPYRSIAYLTAARTGLRLGELASLKWADINFDSKTPHILSRAATAKNSKDSRIPMTIQLERRLLKHRSDDWKPNHPVFPKGVPRARTLQIDLKKADIRYQDEMGRYADFHSLRYTWGTYLQRNGVNSRTAMELMRHSDRKLTDKIYTDSNLLPTGEVIRNLPDDEPLTEISGKSGQNGSNSVKKGLVKTEPKNRLEPASIQGLVPKRAFETLVEVAGIEPARAGEPIPVNKRGLDHSTEALIKILTNLTDEDRQLLTRIVERWGDLSDELKRAVLRVVG